MNQSMHTTSAPRTRLELAHAWMKAYNNWNVPLILSYMTEAQDFHYSYLPASVGITPKSRRDYHEYATFMKSIIPDFQGDILSVHDSSDSSGPVIAHAVGRATSTRTGAPFCQEYMVLIYIRPERGALKIYKVEEFVDSRFVHEYFTAERLHGRRPMTSSVASAKL